MKWKNYNIMRHCSIVYEVTFYSPQELIDVEGDGLADMVFRCIQEMDIDNRMMVIL